MEVRGNGGTSDRYSAATRVYAPTRGSAAVAYELQSEALPARPEQAQRERAGTKERPRTQTMGAGGKLALIISMIIVSASLLFVIGGYERIAREYSAVNKLNREITESGLRLAELNVKLECAVDLEDAKAAAERMGMTYPTAEQYVRAGDALPIEGEGDPAAPTQ